MGGNGETVVASRNDVPLQSGLTERRQGEGNSHNFPCVNYSARGLVDRSSKRIRASPE